MRQFLLFIMLVCLVHVAFSQQKSTHSEYIEKYKSLAIREMQLYRIPASITLAQGIIESNCGASPLASQAKNHFGIKCQKDWTGERFLFDDDTLNECFRKYNNVDESFRDHSLFLTSRSRYAQLFTLPLTDYRGWAYGLKFTGYATNPEYANILIRTIENDKLYLFDDTTSISVVEKRSQNNENLDVAINKKISDSARAPGTVYSSSRVLFRQNYRMPQSSSMEFSYTSKLGRKVYLNNGVHCIFAADGDTWYSIASEFGIYASQIYRQNDMKEHDNIISGQILYLEPKKKKNREGSYKVENGDSMYAISQLKCVKMKYLLKYNNMIPGDEPEAGFLLNLKSTLPRTALFR